MKQTILLFLAVTLLTSCKTHKTAQLPPLPVVPIETNTDTKIVHIETIDTVHIEIPAQSAERTTSEKISHLETCYAESDARINEDGTLWHTLKNKTAQLTASVKSCIDTIYISKEIEKPVPVIVPKEVERELTWWEKTRLNTWGWLAITLAIYTGWICRKPIISLARRIMTKAT